MSGEGFDLVDAAAAERTALIEQLRDARDIIVQLQRELERARATVEQQREAVRRAFLRTRREAR